MTKHDWIITFYSGELGAYRIRYPNKLSFWQRLCIRMAGWEVKAR